MLSFFEALLLITQKRIGLNFRRGFCNRIRRISRLAGFFFKMPYLTIRE
ncbi:hypothetical protein LEP1GSC058_2305 [Leptospira fainei serovar Hurstbridge str. BUT 6]|uniref:Uncharacterized protein n=1 Tax=Leptospira fainei serovar Hurstbridge str. BUT 6 TaxID=1193011 RepID=S3V238_9LEPT|nr:hypothetical protein LEP1GSC058_2305 [Leptospira fainei serovar Hurstbridge str. BUT 6]